MTVVNLTSICVNYSYHQRHDIVIYQYHWNLFYTNSGPKSCREPSLACRVSRDLSDRPSGDLNTQSDEAFLNGGSPNHRKN